MSQDPHDPPLHPPRGPETGRHQYVVTYVTPGCSNYMLSQQIEVYTIEPPPGTLTISGEGDCNGTTLTLDEAP